MENIDATSKERADKSSAREIYVKGIEWSWSLEEADPYKAN